MNNPKKNKPNSSLNQNLSDPDVAIRLRQLESELEPPVLPTVKHRPEGRMTQSMRQWLKVAKFIGVVTVAGIVAIVVWRVATFLSTFVIVGIVAWILYKLFWEADRPKQ